MHLKLSSGKWWPYCLGLNVLSFIEKLPEHSDHHPPQSVKQSTELEAKNFLKTSHKNQLLVKRIMINGAPKHNWTLYVLNCLQEI